MKLRDLFRRRPDAAPEPPAPAPARRPDWPAMPPVQRVVSSPDLITAPDRFSGSLVSWQNPSRSGTLGHYVTLDAPSGVSDGLAAASPRGELPAPAQPWWWPRSPAVQRQASTPAPPTEMAPVSADDQAPSPLPAVPCYPVTTHTLVSAAGAEPPPLRLALPAVQRQIAESATSPAAVADPDLPAGESAPEAALPSVIPAPTGPPPETPDSPAVPSPGGRPDLPSARRFGLGAPLQRIPDTTGEQTLQRQDEVGAGPMDLTPLVSDSPAMAAVAPSPSDPVVIPSPGPPTRSSEPDAALQRVVDAALAPGSRPVRLPETERTGPTTTTPVGGAPSPVQRQADVEPVAVAPLVSGSRPLAAASPVVPPAEPVAASGLGGSGPSVGSPVRSAVLGFAVQRAAEAVVDPGSSPVRLPSDEPPTTATPPVVVTPPIAVGDGLSSVQRHAEIEVEPVAVVPLVSGSPPMPSVEVAPPVTPSAEPVAGSGLGGPGLGGAGPSVGSPVRSAVLGFAVQRAAEAVVDPGSSPVRLPSDEPPTTATPPVVVTPPIAVGDGLFTVQRQAIEVEPVVMAPLVSGSPPMPSVEVAPPVTPLAAPGPGSGFAGSSPLVGSAVPGPAVQRAAEAAVNPGSSPVRLSSDEPTAAATLAAIPAAAAISPATATPPAVESSPIAVGDGLSSVQREGTEVEPVVVAPLVSGFPPMGSVEVASPVVPPAGPREGSGFVGSGSSIGSPVCSTVPGLAVQRAAETAVEPGSSPVRLPSDEPPTAATPPAAATPTLATTLPLTAISPVAVGDGLSTVQRQVEAGPVAVAPLVSGSPPMASVEVASPDTRSARSAAGSGSAEPSRSPSSPTRSAVPGPAVQRAVGRALDPAVELEPRPVEVSPLLSDSPPMASMVDPQATTSAGEPEVTEPLRLPAAAAPLAGARSVVQRQVEAEPLEVAPLVSDSPLMGSVAGSAIPPEPSQALPDTDHTDGLRTVTYDGVAPAAVGLVGDRAIEPIATNYAAAVDSAGAAGAALAAEQSRSRAVQRHASAAGHGAGAPVSGPGMVATVVQRSVGAGAPPAAQWPDALALSRPSPGLDQQVSPAQPVQVVQLAPAEAQSHPLQLTTELVVQRVEGEPAAAAEPAMTTDPATTTGAATTTGPGAGTTPAQPTGPTSPTEVDALVRRLYAPLVRRIKAELQLDRERAGRTLDLWH